MITMPSSEVKTKMTDDARWFRRETDQEVVALREDALVAKLQSRLYWPNSSDAALR